MPSAFILEVVVEPKNRADQATFKRALYSVLDGDRSLAACEDEETGQTIVRATDEYRLDAAIDRLRHDLDGRLDIGAPQVAYREYLAKPVDIDYTHKKQSGGTGQFGRVKVKLTPGERGSGIIFKDEIKGGNIPKEYIPAIEKGFRETAATGSLVGFPIIDFEILLYDGAYHDVDSSVLGFEITARAAMREAAQKSGIKLLEPIMKVVILTPNRWREAVVTDLAGRRAAIENQSGGNLCVVVALAPMAQLFGYKEALASASQGEARCAMLLNHYEQVPDEGVFPDDTFPVAAALRA